MSKKEPVGPFEGLTLKQQEVLPVLYPRLELAPVTPGNMVKSTYHRSEAYNCHYFHKPFSLYIRHDED